jgi:hypothetical protein
MSIRQCTRVGFLGENREPGCHCSVLLTNSGEWCIGIAGSGVFE